jgi:hypothetical protein
MALEDHNFVALSNSEIVDMVVEVDRLRAELDRLRTVRAEFEALLADVVGLRAELDRVRGERDRLFGRLFRDDRYNIGQDGDDLDEQGSIWRVLTWMTDGDPPSEPAIVAELAEHDRRSGGK